MNIKMEDLLEKILRELQDIKVILQENSDGINSLIEKDDIGN